MGMFDSIYMNVKCPYCGISCEREIQTKDLDSVLLTLRPGDSIDKDYQDLTQIEGVVECTSIVCNMKK